MSIAVRSVPVLLTGLFIFAPSSETAQGRLEVTTAALEQADAPQYRHDAAPYEAAEGREPATTPPPSTELRDALAHVVIERNVVASQRDSLEQQRWLIIAYAAFASLLAAWFLRTSLQHLSAVRQRLEPLAPTTRPTDKGRAPTNATITIRNGTTQQPELVDRVATRRLFRPRSPATATTRMMVAPVKPVAAATPPVPPKAVPTPVKPTPSSPRSETHDYPPSDAMPTTLIGSRPSILLAPGVVDVLPEAAEEPETTTQVRIARQQGRELARQGLSLLEVMISLAILATVLTSVSSGIFVLSSAQHSINEEATVSTMMRTWAERIMGADWEWLGRSNLDDPLQGAWSWQRPEVTGPPPAGDHPALIEPASESVDDLNVQLLADEPSGLSDLHCYLEYYHSVAIELCFTPPDGTSPRPLWNEVRTAYRLAPPIDLRQHLDAVVVRLSATWRSQDGGNRRRELVFARTR